MQYLRENFIVENFLRLLSKSSIHSWSQNTLLSSMFYPNNHRYNAFHKVLNKVFEFEHVKDQFKSLLNTSEKKMT